MGSPARKNHGSPSSPSLNLAVKWPEPTILRIMLWYNGLRILDEGVLEVPLTGPAEGDSCVGVVGGSVKRRSAGVGRHQRHLAERQQGSPRPVTQRVLTAERRQNLSQRHPYPRNEPPHPRLNPAPRL